MCASLAPRQHSPARSGVTKSPETCTDALDASNLAGPRRGDPASTCKPVSLEPAGTKQRGPNDYVEPLLRCFTAARSTLRTTFAPACCSASLAAVSLALRGSSSSSSISTALAS